MKITIRQIAKAFFKKSLFSHETKSIVIQDSPIERLVDSIKDYQRKVDVYPVFCELQQFNELFLKDKQLLIKQLIKDYAQQHNLEPSSITELPVEKKNEYNQQFEKMLNAEVNLSKSLVFTDTELSDSLLPISEWNSVEPFLNIKKS